VKKELDWFDNGGINIAYQLVDRHLETPLRDKIALYWEGNYMDRIPEQYIVLLGALKAGGVIGPLFSAFGPDAVKDRVGDCEGKVLITSPKFLHTVHEILGELPALETVIIVNKRNTPYELKEKEVSYENLIYTTHLAPRENQRALFMCMKPL
jgi:acetyl-CoA synthetase